MTMRVLECVVISPGSASAADWLSRRDQLGNCEILIIDDSSAAQVQPVKQRRDCMYFRPPRRLGMARCSNVACAFAISQGYDFLVISDANSVLGSGSIDRLRRACELDSSVAASIAWPVGGSDYGLPNDDPSVFLAARAVFDLVGDAVANHYGDAVLEVPIGHFYGACIRTSALLAVQGFDPVFSPSCGDQDWILRARSRGWRVVLAPSALLYRASSAAGDLSGHETTSSTHQEIIDLQYPLFSVQRSAFLEGGSLDETITFAVDTILRRVTRERGWVADVGWDKASKSGGPTQVWLHPEKRDWVCVVAEGFRQEMAFTADDRIAALTHRFQRAPLSAPAEMPDHRGPTNTVRLRLPERAW